MHSSKLPVTVQRWADANPHIVQSIHTEIDEFQPEYGNWSIWCYLKPGWIWDGEVHSVHESRAGDFLQAVKSIERCECDSCSVAKPKWWETAQAEIAELNELYREAS